MRHRRTSWTIVGATALVVALTSTGGCGGSEFTSSGGGSSDASSDATSSDASSLDAPAQCILAPNGVGNERAFCKLEAEVFSACGSCEACRQLDVNDCVSLGDSLSASFKAALGACQSQLGCEDVTTYTNSPCVRAQLAATPLSPAQQAVKTAYCNSCPTSTALCQNIYNTNPDAGAGAGFGLLGLVVSDALAQQIVTQCSQSNPPHCDAFGYAICAALVLCGTAPHSHCTKGLCK